MVSPSKTFTLNWELWASQILMAHKQKRHGYPVQRRSHGLNMSRMSEKEMVSQNGSWVVWVVYDVPSTSCLVPSTTLKINCPFVWLCDACLVCSASVSQVVAGHETCARDLFQCFRDTTKSTKISSDFGTFEVYFISLSAKKDWKEAAESHLMDLSFIQWLIVKRVTFSLQAMFRSRMKHMWKQPLNNGKLNSSLFHGSSISSSPIADLQARRGLGLRIPCRGRSHTKGKYTRKLQIEYANYVKHLFKISNHSNSQDFRDIRIIKTYYLAERNSTWSWIVHKDLSIK